MHLQFGRIPIFQLFTFVDAANNPNIPFLLVKIHFVCRGPMFRQGNDLSRNGPFADFSWLNQLETEK
jgi:hypothetical protein